jgi:hypothetical protein
MRVDKVALKDIDPLRIFTQYALFREREEKDQEKQDEEENEENRKVSEIWESITKEEPGSKVSPTAITGLFKMSPNLHDLAVLLNRKDVQGIIAEILAGEKETPEKREKAMIVRTNLEDLNGKIERENKVWFRSIPLLFRVLTQIQKITIPKLKIS